VFITTIAFGNPQVASVSSMKDGGSKLTERGAIACAQSAPNLHAHDNSGKTAVFDRIALFVAIVQPSKGPKFANRIARYIVDAAEKARIDPYVVTATAYHESKFLQTDGPQKGIMQFTHECFRTYRRRYSLSVDDERDNVTAGAYYIADLMYGEPLASRGGYVRGGSRNSSLAVMWGHYNGCGTHGAYVQRALLIYSRIKDGTPSEWRAWCRDGRSMWLAGTTSHRRRHRH
jgi:hypothetical protein